MHAIPSFFQDEFNIYRKMLFRESQKSVAGLEILNNFVQQVYDAVAKSEDIYEIQRNIRLLSVFHQTLETFNAQVEVVMSSIDEHMYEELMENSPKGRCLRFKDWFCDLSSYQIGDSFHGYISYVLNADSKLCFIKDMNSNAIDFKDYLKSAVEGIPPYGRVFVAELNQKFLRAIRIDAEASNMSFRVRLIDVGETVPLSPNVCKYRLVEDAENMPPMAILCRIEKVNGKVINTIDSIYKKKFDVKINDICINMLEVELFIETDFDTEAESHTFDLSSMDISTDKSISGSNTSHEDALPMVPVQNGRSVTATPTLNPFLTNMCVEINGRAESPCTKATSSTPQSTPKSATQRPTSLPPVPPRQRATSDEVPKIQIPINIVRRQNLNKPEHNNVSSVEVNGKPSTVKQLETIPLSNGIPKENGNSYHTETESPTHDSPCPCKSGAHPKSKSPQTTQENGFFKTQQCPERLVMPSKGTEVAVTPTHVVSADRMYVQLTDGIKRFEEFQYTTLKKVQLQPLNYIPKPNEYILARYEFDQCVYRARVETIDKTNVTVFYVDYGNKEYVNFDGLFEWHPICNGIPFQAVMCQLGNVRSLPSSSAAEIYEYINHNYLTKPCKAFILETLENDLLVKLKNAYGRDIVEEISANLFPECIV